MEHCEICSLDAADDHRVSACPVANFDRSFHVYHEAEDLQQLAVDCNIETTCDMRSAVMSVLFLFTR